MQIAELAKQLNTSNEVILKTLKSLKLKAKDSQQELSSAVISVIKSELGKLPLKEALKQEVKPVEEKAPIKEKETKEKELKKKIEVKGKEKAAKTKKSEKEESSFKATAVKEPPKKEVGKKEVHFKVAHKQIITKDPIITLKPLARKKRKGPMILKEERKDGALMPEKTEEKTSSSASAQEEATIFPGSQAASKGADQDILTDIEARLPISVKDFSVKIQQKSSAVLKELLRIGIFANINQYLNEEIANKVAHQFGYNIVQSKSEEEQLLAVHKIEQDNKELLKPRAPVVTFMGHVDHGKTSLLDKIRQSKVADSEHGGITQHIGAYSVKVPKGNITFLDTPGHEAFTSMRARGAHLTDMVVLVIAADEGVMPQTEEALSHARAAGVPIVVALNKIDKRNADPDRVKKQLSEIDLMPEDWGGKTVVVGVSATTGQGIDQLLEMILLETELLELKTNDEKKALGTVIEANLSQGKGVVATVIVQSGTLKEGDMVVVGPDYGKVKAMFDDHERLVKQAGPSMPVAILGLHEVPQAGDIFYVVDDEKQARGIALKRLEQLKNERLRSVQKISLEDLYAQIQKGAVKELKVVLKADVQGSLGALKDSLMKIPDEKVKLNFIHRGVGDINASDVILAYASNAIIIGFQVEVNVRAKEELEKQPVDVRTYRIIYDAVNDIKNALEGLLEPKTKKRFVSRVEIRQVFKLSRSGTIAGCYVSKGKIHRKVLVDILREGQVVHSGKLSSLKRFKDDVREVNEGLECGIAIEGFDQIQVGDTIEAYDLELISQKL